MSGLARQPLWAGISVTPGTQFSLLPLVKVIKYLSLIGQTEPRQQDAVRREPQSWPLISGHHWQSGSPVFSVPIGQTDRILFCDWPRRSSLGYWFLCLDWKIILLALKELSLQECQIFPTPSLTCGWEYQTLKTCGYSYKYLSTTSNRPSEIQPLPTVKFITKLI